ncbi:MAG: homoserine dehydrogenase [Pseudomonadales bacterium]|nr:homoserine dehydrogenase [Pseudomonadales bacterium]
MQPLRVGVCGLGTVAQGVLEVLARNADLIERRAGRRIVVTRVASRRARTEVDLRGATFSLDVADIPGHPDVDVVVELIGGDGLAVELISSALECGKPVVTANKAAIARHGDRLRETAQRQGVALNFEAAVAGGIPIIASLTQGLAANRIDWLAGIINGTSNFILTGMSDGGADFASALAEAQRLGYAEADPTFDVEGIDAAHKLAILCALAFDTGFRFDAVYTEGISRITPEDIEYARRLGYRIKHLGIARRTVAGVEARVHPTLVPDTHLVANVNGVMNAVLVHGDATGSTLFYGAGAGGLPTASAVVADLVEIARATRCAAPPPAYPAPLEAPAMLPIEAATSAHYLRIPSLDRPGVFARVATLLSERDISIESALQRAQAIHAESQNAWVPIVIVTQPVAERVIQEAVAAVQALPDVVGEVVRIRVEDLADA